MYWKNFFDCRSIDLKNVKFFSKFGTRKYFVQNGWFLKKCFVFVDPPTFNDLEMIFFLNKKLFDPGAWYLLSNFWLFLKVEMLVTNIVMIWKQSRSRFIKCSRLDFFHLLKWAQNLLKFYHCSVISSLNQFLYPQFSFRKSLRICSFSCFFTLSVIIESFRF